MSIFDRFIERVHTGMLFERQCWEVIRDGEDTGYFLVTDLPRIRFYKGPSSGALPVPFDRVVTREFRQFGDDNKKFALRWIEHVSLRAGFIFAIQFWRREP